MSGMLSNNQMVTTLGTDVTVTINSNGDVYIDNAMVTVVDLVGDNGVIHVIGYGCCHRIFHLKLIYQIVQI